jgi:hypothetical protein
LESRKEKEVFIMSSSKGKTWMLVLMFVFLTGVLLPLTAEACGGYGGGSGYQGQGMGYGAYGSREPGYQGGYCPRMSTPPCCNYGGPSGNRGAGYGGGFCQRFAYNQRRNNPANPQTGPALNQGIEKDARDKAIKQYQDTYGKKEGITANVTDYGCHIKIDVYEKDKLVKSYIYQQGNVFEM